MKCRLAREETKGVHTIIQKINTFKTNTIQIQKKKK